MNILQKLLAEKLAVLENYDNLVLLAQQKAVELEEVNNQIANYGDLSVIKAEAHELQEYIYALGIEERPIENVEVENEVIEETEEVSPN